MLIEQDKTQFQEALLDWFDKEHRTLPWRHYSDPYAALVAEKLLQQSRARLVLVSAYNQLVAKYPTPRAMSMANIEELERVIQPLGFTYRASELVVMAQEIIERHQGQVPCTLKELLALTGVGDYSARAILSFTYGKDVPVVDTNVARFLYRVFGLPGPLPSNPARKKSLIELAASLIPEGKSRDFNLAILDLCALICKPTNPLCPSCPVRRFCLYEQAVAAEGTGAPNQVEHNQNCIDSSTL